MHRRSPKSPVLPVGKNAFCINVVRASNKLSSMQCTRTHEAISAAGRDVQKWRFNKRSLQCTGHKFPPQKEKGMAGIASLN